MGRELEGGGGESDAEKKSLPRGSYDLHFWVAVRVIG